ncbi:hypothetical protein EMPS_10646 [Entomortierella parvispora]|uniref:Uncharacterized protein n=1 Tax=Entomortierella parvispora TaxID=205924 RepID=A0A9P3HLA2_9FUNG|nr:hypothetical protein EMPS_10646 [Entomortierella parvispora]
MMLRSKDSGSHRKLVKKSSVARPHLKIAAASLREAALGASRDTKSNVATSESHIKSGPFFESRDSHDDEIKDVSSNLTGDTNTTTTTTSTTATTTTEERSFARWILNNKDAATGYDDETFGLWIPITSPRKMVEPMQEHSSKQPSQHHQQRMQQQQEESMHDAVQRSGSYGGMSMDMDMDLDLDEELTSAPSSESSVQTEHGEAVPERAEMEDMKVLPEVVNFSLVILMRASASLFPYVAEAESKSVPLRVPWVDLGNTKNEKYIIERPADYATKVMGDIGDALVAMREVYEQLRRPFGHADNQRRDVRQQFGPYYGVVVFPPHRPRRRPSDIWGSSGTTSGGGAMDKCSKVNSRWGPQSARGLTPTSPAPQSPFHQRTLSVSSASPATKIASSSPIKKPKMKHAKAAGSFHRLKENFNIPTLLRSLSSSKSNADKNEDPMSSASSAHWQGDSSPQQQHHPLNRLTLQVPAHSPFGSTTSTSPSRGLCSANSFSSLSRGLSAFSALSSKSKDSRWGSLISPASDQMHGSFLDAEADENGTAPSAADGSNACHTSKAEKLSYDDDDKVQNEEWSIEERKWKVDILRRQAYLRAWACRRFLDLYEYSVNCIPMDMGSTSMWSSQTPSPMYPTYPTLESEFHHLYRIIKSVLEIQDTVVSNRGSNSGSQSPPALFQAASMNMFSFNPVTIPEQALEKLREIITWDKKGYEAPRPAYSTVSVEEMEKTKMETDSQIEHEFRATVMQDTEQASLPAPKLGLCTTLENEVVESSKRNSAYNNMKYFGLQNHGIWEPLLDRLVKFDSTNRRLNADSIYQFIHRMHIDEAPVVCKYRGARSESSASLSPSYASSIHSVQSQTKKSIGQWLQFPSTSMISPLSASSFSLSPQGASHPQYQNQIMQRTPCASPQLPLQQDSITHDQRLEFLRVLWVLDQCVEKRPDREQSLTWFRLSSSASAVKSIVDYGGILPYLRALRVAGSVAAMTNGQSQGHGNVGGSTLSIPSSVRSGKGGGFLSIHSSHRGGLAASASISGSNGFFKKPQQYLLQTDMGEGLRSTHRMDSSLRYKDPIMLLQPVTLTGYLKMLLRQVSGLLLKETTLLFVELTRPIPTSVDSSSSEDDSHCGTFSASGATDGSSKDTPSTSSFTSESRSNVIAPLFFDKLLPIDHSLLVRVLCLEPDRGTLFLKFTRIMGKILNKAPPCMEVDGVALAKMVQVIEPNGVFDLTSLARWHVAWSALITAYALKAKEEEMQKLKERAAEIGQSSQYLA